MATIATHTILFCLTLYHRTWNYLHLFDHMELTPYVTYLNHHALFVLLVPWYYLYFIFNFFFVEPWDFMDILCGWQPSYFFIFFYISFDIFVICFTMKSGTPLPPGSRHCFATGFSWLRCAPPCRPQGSRGRRCCLRQLKKRDYTSLVYVWL